MKDQVKKAALGDADALVELNRVLEPLSAEKRVAWSLANLPGAHVLSSSFGAQAAVSLHMVTRQAPRIPVILLDTGYLFPETYAFVEKLTERLALNLKVYRSTLSPAWIEARFGKLWEQGVAGLAKYHDLTKLEPMRRALRETGARSWFSGLRRSQARTRKTSGRSNGATGACASTRSWTGAIATWASTSRSTSCPTTRCGTAVMCRSVTGTRPAPCTKWATRRRRASSASSASAGCTA